MIDKASQFIHSIEGDANNILDILVSLRFEKKEFTRWHLGEIERGVKQMQTSIIALEKEFEHVEQPTNGTKTNGSLTDQPIRIQEREGEGTREPEQVPRSPRRARSMARSVRAKSKRG